MYRLLYVEIQLQFSNCYRLNIMGRQISSSACGLCTDIWWYKWHNILFPGAGCQYFYTSETMRCCGQFNFMLYDSGAYYFFHLFFFIKISGYYPQCKMNLVLKWLYKSLMLLFSSGTCKSKLNDACCNFILPSHPNLNCCKYSLVLFLSLQIHYHKFL